jgi:hypothetical protein
VKNKKNGSILMIIGPILQEQSSITTRETFSQKYGQGLNSGNDEGENTLQSDVVPLANTDKSQLKATEDVSAE